VKRYIDGAITKFWVVMMATTIGLFGLLALWVAVRVEGIQAPYTNVAFAMSWIISLLSLIPVFWVMKRRPIDQPTTWGEAMIGSTYVFFILFWIYGTVPHQWLTYAEAELNWRSDVFLIGWRTPWDANQGILEWALPFDLSYATLKDLIAVVIYGIGLVANVAVFVMWLQEVDAAWLSQAVKPKQFIHIDQSECITCEGCVDICPWKCIHMVTPDAID